MRMCDIRVSHLEGTIINAQVGDSTKNRMKSLFNMLYKYAVAHDIVEKDYASVMFANGNPIKRSRIREAIPFSQEEIQAFHHLVKTTPVLVICHICTLLTIYIIKQML